MRVGVDVVYDPTATGIVSRPLAGEQMPQQRMDLREIKDSFRLKCQGTLLRDEIACNLAISTSGLLRTICFINYV